MRMHYNSCLSSRLYKIPSIASIFFRTCWQQQKKVVSCASFSHSQSENISSQFFFFGGYRDALLLLYRREVEWTEILPGDIPLLPIFLEKEEKRDAGKKHKARFYWWKGWGKRVNLSRTITQADNFFLLFIFFFVVVKRADVNNNKSGTYKLLLGCVILYVWFGWNGRVQLMENIVPFHNILCLLDYWTLTVVISFRIIIIVIWLSDHKHSKEKFKKRCTR